MVEGFEYYSSGPRRPKAINRNLGLSAEPAPGVEERQLKTTIMRVSFLLLVVCTAGAQSRQILHTFSGMDGSAPFGLISDAAGNFYGVANVGGGTKYCCGTIFEVSPVGGGWKTTILHDFGGGQGGANPVGSLAMDARGNLFGVTQSGGTPTKPCNSTCGTVFELSPKSGGGWTYSVIYRFQGNSVGDGSVPDSGVIVDAAGNLYGTTQLGGLVTSPRQCSSGSCGTVFELSPGAGGWTETVLYKFSGNPDGAYPRSPLLLDANGNLEGATSQGGGGRCSTGFGTNGCGTIFQLVPSGGGWTENVLYRFQGSDGEIPYQGLISDAAHNLYGTTNLGGLHGWGAVFELSPISGGGWSETTLYNFQGSADGIWPAGGLTMDTSGNLYGTASGGGAHNAGTVFKLSQASGGRFTFGLVTSFTGNDGSFPSGNMVVDGAGNLYGTARFDGQKGHGVVFKITP
jgi:uncharacterized repeat protein (TIGR03803 family)